MDSVLARLLPFSQSLDREGGGGREVQKVILYPIFAGARETWAAEAEHSLFLGFSRHKILPPPK